MEEALLGVTAVLMAKLESS